MSRAKRAAADSCAVRAARWTKCEVRAERGFRKRAQRAILANVSEYAKPRRCFQHKLSLSDNPILSVLSFDFNKRGLGEENSDTFKK